MIYLDWVGDQTKVISFFKLSDQLSFAVSNVRFPLLLTALQMYYW